MFKFVGKDINSSVRYRYKRKNDLKTITKHARCPSLNESLKAADDYERKKIKTIHLKRIS